MPRMEIEGFEKGTPVRVRKNSRQPVEDEESKEVEGWAFRASTEEIFETAVGKTGVVSWTYASDVDGSPWVWVVMDHLRGREADRVIAYPLDDVELLVEHRPEAKPSLELAEPEPEELVATTGAESI